jgi:signal peptidase I
VLRHPAQNHRIYIKRIVGLPDESISLRNGVVCIGDLPLHETYLTSFHNLHRTTDREWWMGPHEYFVMGDNRSDSEDSRIFGPVSRDLIVGSVWFRYWPLRAWGKVPGGSGQYPRLTCRFHTDSL